MIGKTSALYHCPVEFTLDVLGGKWKTVILCHLKHEPARYSELRALIPSLSDKVLTERLKELASAGLIARGRGASRTGGEMYRLTSRGETLRVALGELYKWGRTHADAYGVELREVRKARSA